MDIHETPASYRVVSASHSLHKMPFSQVVCIIWQALISVFSFLNPPEKLANSFLDGLLYFDNLKLLLMAMPAYGSPKSTKVTAFSNWSPSSTATAAISASQKSDKTNWTGQAPIRNIPISSGTEPDYFRSTPTKATIPISVPTKIPANHWHRYATAPMPKTKTDNRLTTSTATKSAYRKR